MSAATASSAAQASGTRGAHVAVGGRGAPAAVGVLGQLSGVASFGASLRFGAAGHSRPLPRSFDGAVAFIAVQSHLAALITITGSTSSYRSLPVCLMLLACSLAVPLGCILAARRNGGELTGTAFLTAALTVLVLDVAAMSNLHPDQVGGQATWAVTAIGVSLLVLSPYRPPAEILALAAAHGLLSAGLLSMHSGPTALRAFSVLDLATSGIWPAVFAAQYVTYYVLALRRRQEVVSAQVVAEARATAARVIRQDATARMQRLRAEVLPLLSAVARGERAVDDPNVARLAATLSAELRRELVEARTGSWLLDADSGGEQEVPAGRSWPGVIMLDPQRLVRRMLDGDLAALSAVLTAMRRARTWIRVSVALSYADDPAERTAHLTVVAQAPDGVSEVDPAVAAVSERLGCRAEVEPPNLCIVEGEVTLRPSPR
jgi:hypothetical protein